MIRRRTALLLAAGALVLAGCAPLVDQDQVTVEPGTQAILEAGHPLGQTFVARHAGLSGLDVWVEPGRPGELEIRLHLRTDPQAGDDLTAAVLQLIQILILVALVDVDLLVMMKFLNLTIQEQAGNGKKLHLGQQP